MQNAKDYGFNEGFLLETGALPPEGHTSIGSVTDKEQLVVPDTILDDEYTQYTNTLGSPVISRNPEQFGAAFGNAKTLLNTIGIKKIPESDNINVGTDYRGGAIYSDVNLSNDTDTKKGQGIIGVSGMALGAMGAFRDTTEAQRFVAIGEKAADPEFLTKLDGFKSGGDAKSFVNNLSSDKSISEFTAYKLYENWANLSPAQKSMAVGLTGMQDFRFDDGKSFKEKKLTPEIPGVPALNAAEGLKLASNGVNVAPAARKWNQYSVIQETMYPAKSATDVVTTANSIGILGAGMEGVAVPMDDQMMSTAQMTPAPQYGIGGATIPVGGGIPSGYKAVRNVGDRTIIVPQANQGTSFVNAPEVASESAAQVYRRWKSNGPVKQTQGVKGGSMLAAGLASMTGTNPYTMGAVLTHATLANVGGEDVGDLKHVSQIAGVSLQRLLHGNTDNDKKGLELAVDGEFNEKSYGAAMKQIRGEFAKQGVSSKEMAYQLANQGYAENRFDDSQVVSLHRAIDMVFDDKSFTLAQKLNTGKAKGMEIIKKRRG